ncbi:MAG: hypothetical protein J6113_03660, partial [Lachnospiraceae bacterium]|nr:hypothetical protein [Lachnospiraceae bacterium]
GTFHLNYVALKDTRLKRPVVVAGMELTEEAVRELITLRNSSLDEEVPFKLVLKEEDPINVDYSPQLGLENNEELEKKLKELGIDGLGVGKATRKELKKLYGLKEDDSLERFWREEMGLDIETVILLQQTVDNYEAMLKVTAEYYVVPAEGGFTPAELYSVEIKDTERLRFVYNKELTGESVNKFNFSLYEEPVNNLIAKDGIIYIPSDRVFGVVVSGGVYSLATDEQGNPVEEGADSGTLDYDGTLNVGDTIAVYTGEINNDGTVKTGEIAYFNITKVVGEGKYDYVRSQFEDVIFIPDVIPVKDDGSFDDGKCVVSASELDFSNPLYANLKLNADTKVEKGDFIAFYTGDITNAAAMQSVGFGRIYKVTQNGASLEIEYTKASQEEILDAMKIFTGYQDTDIPVTEEDARRLRNEMQRQVEESGYAEQASRFVISLLTDDKFDPETSEFSDEVKQLKFRTPDGKDLPVGEVRKLADGAKKVKVSDPTVNFAFSITLQHFEGKGIRAEFTVSLTIEIELNSVGSTTNKIEIQLMAGFEQEIILGLALKSSSEWKWYAFIPVLQEINLQASFRAGTFSGFGAVATVQTKADNNNEDEEWDKLITTTNGSLTTEAGGLAKLGGKLESLSNALDVLENGSGYQKEGKEKGGRKDGDDDGGSQGLSTGGGLADKYSGMLESDAEYIYLVKQELFRLAAHPDPFCLLEFSLEADFVVSMKINAMIGISISYGNAKQYCYNIKVFARKSTSTNEDIETPNFRTDFFAFGMIGFRVGVLIDVRVGLISTKMDSIGVTAEAGLYAELYGFLYVYYAWESGKGSEWGAMGSLLFEVGAYLEINFVAQLGDGKLSKSVELYANKWPFVQLGAVAVPMDFAIDEDDDKLDIEFTAGKSTMKVPDELFGINMMALATGEVEEENCDSKEKGLVSYSFSINGREYTQYSEEHFKVECFDLTGENGTVTSNHSFQYLPATNEIYVKPVDQNKDEYWGIIKFTYLNDAFGFNTQQYSRTVKVHWKGVPASASVNYYTQKEDGTYEFYKTGSFDGFDGVQYDLVINDDVMYQFDGYRLAKVHFSEQERMNDFVAGLEKLYDEAAAVFTKEKTPANFAALHDISEKYYTAFENRNNYFWYLERAIKEQRGTLYFLMIANETTADLYFDIATNYTNWYVLRDSEKDCSGLTQAEIMNETVDRYIVMHNNLKYGYFANWYQLCRKNAKVIDSMPAAISDYTSQQHGKDIDWFYCDCGKDAEVSLYTAMNSKDKWIPLTSDIEMPDRNVYIFGIPRFRGYTVTWMDGEEEIRKDTVPWNTVLEQMTGEEVEELGFGRMDGIDFGGWALPDGTPVGEGYVMPEEDIVLQAVWVPRKHTITCLSQYATVTFDAYVGDDILEAINNPYGYFGHRSVWVAEGSGTEIVPGMTMPNQDITIRLDRYEPKEYTITWMDGDKVVATTTGVFNRPVTAPDYKDESKGSYIMWYDPNGAAIVKDYIYAYDEDIVMTAKFFSGEHVWDDGVITKEPTCTEYGEITYTCKDCGEKRVEKVVFLGHNFPETGKVLKEATCSTDGEMELTCTRCGETKIEKIAATGAHKWGPTTYTWSADNSTVTATHRCSVCGHDETETVRTTSRLTRQATCEQAAVVTYTTEAFFSRDFTVQTKDIESAPALGHKWGTPVYTWSDDYSKVTATITCENDRTHTITETVSTTSRVTRAATYDTVGETTYTATFTNAAFTTQTKAVENIPQLDGTWNAPTYSWSADNSSVTATRTRVNNANDKETETIAATSNITAATCTAAGYAVYTATFTNPAFTKQTKTVELPALGHDWGTGTITKAEGPDLNEEGFYAMTWHAGERTYTCSRCGETKTETELVKTYAGDRWIMTRDGDEKYTYYITGSTHTLNLQDNYEQFLESGGNLTFAEYYSSVNDLETVEDVIRSVFGMFPDKKYYIIMDDGNPFTIGVEGSVTIIEGAKDTVIREYTGKSLTVKIRFTVDRPDIFTTPGDLTVIINWP